MKRFWSLIAASLFAAGCSPAGGAQVHKLVTEQYGITLNGDWAEERSTDPEQRSFYSKTKDVGLVMSALPMNPPRYDTGVVARKMVEFRLAGEEDAAKKFNLKMTIAEPMVIQRPWGHAIAYYGSDTNGRHFSYAGAVIPKAVISIYVESPSASEEDLKAILDDLLGSLEFDKTNVSPRTDQRP